MTQLFMDEKENNPNASNANNGKKRISNHKCKQNSDGNDISKEDDLVDVSRKTPRKTKPSKNKVCITDVNNF